MMIFKDDDIFFNVILTSNLQYVEALLPMIFILSSMDRMNLHGFSCKCDTIAAAQAIWVALVILPPYAPPTLRTITFTLQEK